MGLLSHTGYKRLCNAWLHYLIPNECFHLYSQDLLTRHKVLVAEYLEQNYDAVSDLTHTYLQLRPAEEQSGKHVMGDL